MKTLPLEGTSSTDVDGSALSLNNASGTGILNQPI
jgi:hypothetical protein